MGGLFGDRTASADRLNSAFESMSVNNSVRPHPPTDAVAPSWTEPSLLGLNVTRVSHAVAYPAHLPNPTAERTRECIATAPSAIHLVCVA